RRRRGPAGRARAAWSGVSLSSDDGGRARPATASNAVEHAKIPDGDPKTEPLPAHDPAQPRRTGGTPAPRPRDTGAPGTGHRHTGTGAIPGPPERYRRARPHAASID